jgi:long-subunit acyl-CoA synthetase (AMP-forming)
MRGRAGSRTIALMSATTAPPTHATIAAAFLDTVARQPDAVAVRTRDDAVSLTWRELADRVAGAAGGLRALGVRPGDTVALLSANRPELWVADLAVTMCGATTCPIYTTLPPHDIDYVLRDAGARIVIAEAALAGGVPDHAELVRIDDLPLDTPIDLAVAAAALDPAALITLIYTSGTTAHPKGVELTHQGAMAALRGWQAAMPLDRVQRIISWLPPAHVMDRVLHYYLALAEGFETTTCSDPRQIASYLTGVRPDLFISPPRVWEKLKAGVETALAGLPEERRDAAGAAIGAALQRVRLLRAGATVPPALEEAVAHADTALFAGLRERLGVDRLAVAGVGSAPCAVEVLEFFHAIGVDLRQGYALSEAGCAGTLTPSGPEAIGTVGHPLAGTELRLADDGEVLLRGAATMAGYRHQPVATYAAIDTDGWLHTGDIGTLDPDGRLTIVDRKKDILITAGGKNISPARVESELKAASPLIAHACAIGDRRPHLTALLVLDPEAAAAADDPEAAVAAAVAKANQRLARVEQIKRYTLLRDEWRPGGAQLTPTLKLRRRAVVDRYAAEIEEMYAISRA